MILVMQTIMLGVLLEKDNTRASIPSESSGSTSPARESPNGQDHDAEERGILRSRPQAQASGSMGSDIELQDILPPGSHYRTGEEDGERSGLLAEPAEEREARRTRDGHPRDPFLSGESVIVEMNILHTIRDQWRQNSSASLAQPPIYTSSRRDPGTTLLRRTFVFDMNIGGRG
jgi:hypothetical protein